MQQSELFHETIFDAVGAGITACGGFKKTAARIWPALNGDGATRLRNALNPEHAQKLCLSEFLLVAKLANAAGDHSIMEFLARDLGYELKPLAPAEAKKRARKARITALLDEVARLTKDDD